METSPVSPAMADADQRAEPVLAGDAAASPRKAAARAAAASWNFTCFFPGPRTCLKKLMKPAIIPSTAPATVSQGVWSPNQPSARCPSQVHPPTATTRLVEAAVYGAALRYASARLREFLHSVRRSLAGSRQSVSEGRPTLR